MIPSRKRRMLKRGIFTLIILFILINVVAIFHAYKFTHFSRKEIARTRDPARLSPLEKMSTLLFGVNNPRPANRTVPSQPFKTILLKSNKEIECWLIPTVNSRGTVIIFHGFSGYKSSMLDKAEQFLHMGYSTLLVDFMGSGGSEGSQTTIGYYEAEQVKTAYEYMLEKGERNIYLFGTSMGSVAIMKSVHDFQLNPAGIILECPFGSMYKTVCARFRLMNAPAFPMAALLVFWGGVQNGFWAFDHNPIQYAKQINCPTLLLYGAKDKKVSRGEIDQMYSNLNGAKHLKVYQLAGHENLLNKYKEEWRRDVQLFMNAR
jgi:alpha-beta hydrolase superfamily lysophospholipase